MQKISVLQIIGDSSLAGAPRHLLSILENIDLEKFNISVICPPGPLAGEIRRMKRKFHVEIVPMRSRLDLRAVSLIRKNIKHLNPEIIHVHGTRAGVLARMGAVALNKKLIYTEHLWTKHFKLQSRLLNIFHYTANWILDMFTSLNIAVSQAVRDFMVSANISRFDKIKVIYNGIEPSEKRVEILKNSEAKLITIGTLNQNKGMQYLIRSLPEIIKEFPQVNLEIIGDGPYKRALQKEIKKRKLGGSVKFVGFTEDVEEYLLKGDVYIQPSLSESFGLAIIQAMNVGLPVVATNTGGIPEVVTEGKSGLLVEPKKPKKLAEAILFLLRNPKEAEKMGKTAKEEVKLKFSLDDMIRQLEQTYEEVQKAPSLFE